MSDDRVEQIVFGWDARNVAFNDGYGPTAFSCDETEARQVFEETRLVLRSRSVPDWPSLGRRCLSGGRVMVFRRTPTTDSVGPPSTICHALVGDGRLLTVLTSLGLHYWDWPLEDGRAIGRVLPPLDDGSLAPKEIERRRNEVKAEFEEPSLNDALTTLIARIVLRPDARLLILDDSDGIAPVPLLYRTRWLFGRNALKTFSTFESDDTGEWQAAFVAEWPTTVSAATVRVDLREQVGDRVGDITKRLLALRQTDEKGVQDLLAEAGRIPDVNARLNRLDRGLPRIGPTPGVRNIHAPDSPLPARRQLPPAVLHYVYSGEFSRPHQVFIAWRPLIRAYRWFRGSDYLPPQQQPSPSPSAQSRSSTMPVEAQIRRLDVDQLITLATSGGAHTGKALRELWRKRAYCSRRDNEYLCRTIVTKRFFIDDHVKDVATPGSRARVELAAALFDIFVRPRPRGRENEEELGDVLVRLWDDHGSLGRTIVTRIVNSRPAFGLDEETWRLLFGRALETPPSALPPPAPASPPHRDRAPHSPDRPGILNPQPARATASPQSVPIRTAGSDFTTRRWLAAMLLAWLVAVIVYLVLAP